jgi:hypothetical protein
LAIVLTTAKYLGKFTTPGDNFLASAEDCWLKVEDRTILVGQLVDIEGNVGQDELDLDELFGNVEGAFEYVGGN